MSKFDFNPEKFKAQLRQVAAELAAGKDYDKVIRRYPKTKTTLFTKADVIAGLRHFGYPGKMLAKPIRTMSGVVPVTLLTKPYPCPGKCIFCPDDVRMPKSYLSAEPGAQRAAANNFDPYNQVTSRLQTYYANNHTTDKVELIILGGTWSAYPLPYKLWFIARCFEALNEFKPVKKLTRPQISGTAEWPRLLKAQSINETAVCRCVGLSIETRPDFITLGQLIELRKMGCTKIQIGIQSLDNRVLKLNRRGHTNASTRKAIVLLRQFGFKIQAHWMANLYGSTPKKDIADFAKLFSQKWYRPDELKIYPCSLIATAELMAYYKKGLWRPYSQTELMKVMVNVLPLVAEYCRVSRMIRDFSGDDIVVGNKITNFRQLVEAKAKKIKEIRFREIRSQLVRPKDLRLKMITYKTSIGREKFLQWVTKTNQIAGFLRLSLPRRNVGPPIKELQGAAVIRELHVYGHALSLGGLGKTQHLGLGRQLLFKARVLAAGYKKLSVISSIGTREYYRRHGFSSGELYQYLKLVD
ncbi:MAG: tRNA uridine(34) 5-carboxymethylaminomethyl modification radical SAM/GNAT enzyme Elp3 [Candidatus Beckwithbacteria bacterium]|nr:tRNA uridine(34) 5-carboxymethylaminomethyl modification radical SAM/GNAT enzyme Elp3 [Candidatus Beckwithbacteria bacterium]